MGKRSEERVRGPEKGGHSERLGAEILERKAKKNQKKKEESS